MKRELNIVQAAESDNSGHLCARTQNRLKRATVKPETVSTYKGKYSGLLRDRQNVRKRPRQYSGRHRNQYSQSGTETETSHRATPRPRPSKGRSFSQFPHCRRPRPGDHVRIRAVIGEQATCMAIVE